VIERDLRRHVYLPPRALLPSGRLKAQVAAIDTLGQEALTPPVPLRVDSLSPRASIHVGGSNHRVMVRISDAGAGVARGSTSVSFGDGSRDRRGSSFRHEYGHGGRFTISVRARDKLGNRLLRRFSVRVR
jgi:hypothetical protein